MFDDALAFLLPLAASVGATPLAIRIAHRHRLLDYPLGWKTHTRPTPYLGGCAVMFAFLLGALAVGGDLSRLWPLLVMGLLIGAVGMIDDDRGLPAKVRIPIEMGAATFLWAEGLGWSVFSSDVANLILTNLWVVALINAMNLLDLMDGVAGTVAAVSSAGVGLLASIEGDAHIAALAFSLSGACVGFLAYNLRRPARIYLGDGGTMAIGLALAGMIAALPTDGRAGWVVLLAAAPLCGVPLFDMALRVFLRRRRGIDLLTAGLDSIANWLEAELRSPWKVAVTLGAAQAVVSALTITALRLGDEAVVSLSVLSAVTALVVGRIITTSSWARAADPPADPEATVSVDLLAGRGDALQIADDLS